MTASTNEPDCIRLLREESENSPDLYVPTKDFDSDHYVFASDILAAYDAIVAERDAAVREIPVRDAERFICLAHPHNNRWEEALCSAKYQLDAAVRERDVLRERANQFEIGMVDALQRLAACERVVEASTLFLSIYDADADMPNECAAAIEALRAAVAAETQGEK
jgi:hypothetical protein